MNGKISYANFDSVIHDINVMTYHFHSDVQAAFPLASAHNSKLTRTQFFKQGEFGRVDLPLAMGQPGRRRFLSSRSSFESACQATGVVGVILDQGRNGRATMFLGQIETLSILLDVVMFHLVWDDKS